MDLKCYDIGALNPRDALGSASGLAGLSVLAGFLAHFPSIRRWFVNRLFALQVCHQTSRSYSCASSV